MRKNKFILQYLPIVALLSITIACAEAPKKEETEQEEIPEVDSTDMDNDEAMMEEDNSFMLPSPIQIAAIFNRAGLGFESGLTNPTENLSKYNTKTSKYLNFGVYSADLAYVVLNEQQQASIDYLNVVKQLSDDIGMPSVFGSGKLIESFEKNINNQDTVLRILTTIKRRTDEYLEENQEKSKEAIFFSAAWLEGMYLGANSSTDKDKLAPRLIEQMTILENVIKAIKVQNDPTLNMDYMVNGLTDLLDTFESFESIKALDQEGTSLESVSLTEEEMAQLNSKIERLRNEVING